MLAQTQDIVNFKGILPEAADMRNSLSAKFDIRFDISFTLKPCSVFPQNNKILLIF